jgi:hypothetical protein
MNVSGTRTRGLLMARSQGQAREEGGTRTGESEAFVAALWTVTPAMAWDRGTVQTFAVLPEGA